MSKDFQEDRHGVDRDRYKRGTKYPENFEEKENYLKVTNPTGDVTVQDVSDLDGLVYEVISEGTPGEKWTIEIVAMTPIEFEALKEY
jgi:hypothetical protein